MCCWSNAFYYLIILTDDKVTLGASTSIIIPTERLKGKNRAAAVVRSESRLRGCGGLWCNVQRAVHEWMQDTSMSWRCEEEWANMSPQWCEILMKSQRKPSLQLTVDKEGSIIYWIKGMTLRTESSFLQDDIFGNDWAYWSTGFII